jgi:hypothetical protein
MIVIDPRRVYISGSFEDGSNVAFVHLQITRVLEPWNEDSRITKHLHLPVVVFHDRERLLRIIRATHPELKRVPYRMYWVGTLTSGQIEYLGLIRGGVIKSDVLFFDQERDVRHGQATVEDILGLNVGDATADNGRRSVEELNSIVDEANKLATKGQFSIDNTEHGCTVRYVYGTKPERAAEKRSFAFHDPITKSEHMENEMYRILGE